MTLTLILFPCVILSYFLPAVRLPSPGPQRTVLRPKTVIRSPGPAAHGAARSGGPVLSARSSGPRGSKFGVFLCKCLLSPTIL